MHKKKPAIDTTDNLRVCIYTNLFAGRNILPDAKGYQYGAIFINETICIRFFIIIKSKNNINKEKKIVFNKIEIYTRKRMQYFWLNNARKYQLLILYFNKKRIF